jgi:hypothetical protein
MFQTIKKREILIEKEFLLQYMFVKVSLVIIPLGIEFSLTFERDTKHFTSTFNTVSVLSPCVKVQLHTGAESFFINVFDCWCKATYCIQFVIQFSPF